MKTKTTLSFFCSDCEHAKSEEQQVTEKNENEELNIEERRRMALLFFCQKSSKKNFDRKKIAASLLASPSCARELGKHVKKFYNYGFTNSKVAQN